MLPYWQEICDDGSSKQTYAFDETIWNVSQTLW
jgi:hypothetical protein